jgi:hypothetical protein
VNPTPLTGRDIDAIVRDVIVHHGLPFTVVSVKESAAGWNIQARADTGEMLHFAVPHDRPTAMRIAIHQHLEAKS